MHRLAIAVLAITFAPTAHAQTDFEVWPVEKAEGVSHFSECPSYSDTCTLWVRLPRDIAAAQLAYPDEDGAQLWAPLSIVDLPQDRVDALYRPSDIHAFLSGGFWGFQLQISRRFAKRASISIGSAESGTVYRLKSVSAWLPSGR